jgi:leucyl/phenylalanyl-tRNA---protein transferase
VTSVEPPGSAWHFPPASEADSDGVVAIGGDLSPGTLLAAYRGGLFPMPIQAGNRATIGWWSPDPRGVIPLDGLIVSRSLRRSTRRYGVTFDRAFDDVVASCGDSARPGGWITGEIAAAYSALHRLGWAHSAETWSPAGDLVGGLYGVAIGGLFAGESMFSSATDASKVALVHLVDRLLAGRAALLDIQWVTDHLATLGAVAIPRDEYLTRLVHAVRQPDAWSTLPHHATPTSRQQ